MIRTAEEDFVIEPLRRSGLGGHGEDEDDEGGRPHIVYPSSAIINSKQRAVNQTADFLRGGKNSSS